MTRPAAPVTFVNGDPYVFDHASGEYVEQHHTIPSHAGSHT